MLTIKWTEFVHLKFFRSVSPILLSRIISLLALSALHGDFFNRSFFLTYITSHPKLLAETNSAQPLTQTVRYKALDRI